MGSTTAGLQVPVMPSMEVFVKSGTGPVPQITRLVPNENVGTVLGRTVILILTGKAQVPAVGVKV